MTVKVVQDSMMDKFKVGDVVVFSLEEDSVYSYEVPKLGTIGIVEVQTYSFGIEQMLGVQIPMSVVQWEDGQKTAVFSHDIDKVEGGESGLLISKLKSITPYTGESNN